jgi:pimeloyl-ACP methyl ester carboxylesterase
MKFMKNKLIFLSTIVLSWQIFTVHADVISDRITVTVRGNGPDILLIPGLASSGAVWAATASHLESHFRLHIIQVAGFAGSPAGSNAQGAIIQPVVDAIDAYIKTNHLKSPKIIGHSLGGLLGMMLAIQHPDDVDRLMIVDSLPFFSVLSGATDATNAAPQAAAMRDYMLAESQESYAAGERQFLYTLVKSPEGQKLAAGWAITSDKSVVARAIYEDMTTDLRPALQKIKAPVTMLYPWDSQSGFPREATDKLYRDNFATLPNAKVLCIENSFHFIMLDQPDKFSAPVDTFLE